RVSRHGCMQLCWSLDKIGPICRNVDDCGLVLAAIHGADPRDTASVDRWPAQEDSGMSTERRICPVGGRHNLPCMPRANS
ncbi:MAG TPA: amidase family protein, partial [Pirellulales bacterium]|nr:amidase family protein [Pirellulales bacterium]